MSEIFHLTRPDDWHLHVRSGNMLNTVIQHTASCFGRALIMPNLDPPVTNAAQAEHYRASILDQLIPSSGFDPVMTLYLTDRTSIETVRGAADSPYVAGFKLYPAGATTNSESGVTSISKIMPILESMAEHNLILQVHGEVTDLHVDIFDREAEFIDQVLDPLHRELPELRIVFEHITSRQGIDFVSSSGTNIAATITPHHLLYSRNQLFAGGIRPHFYCLPILKREEHRMALVEAAISGDSSFFLGTDSAPHLQGRKETNCGCAGIYSAHAAIELYTEIFESMEALDKLEGFASFYGADFYQLARNSETIALQRVNWEIPEYYLVNNPVEISDNDQKRTMSRLVPLRAGETLRWKLVEDQ